MGFTLKKKIKLFLLIFLTVFFLTACKTQSIVELGDTKVIVEIADDHEERARGLMFREVLEEDRGLLFIFKDEKKRSFWMKNTLIPLDMIYIKENGTIDTIQTATPCEKDRCRGYPSKGEAQYVLEVNGGFSEKHDVKEGDRVKIILSS